MWRTFPIPIGLHTIVEIPDLKPVSGQKVETMELLRVDKLTNIDPSDLLRVYGSRKDTVTWGHLQDRK